MSKDGIKYYHVVWDNGNHACGEFDIDFLTGQEAHEHGENWAREMNAMETLKEWEDGYTFDVVPIYDIDGLNG